MQKKRRKYLGCSARDHQQGNKYTPMGVKIAGAITHSRFHYPGQKQLGTEVADSRMIKADENRREDFTRWLNCNSKKYPMLSVPYPM